MKSTVLKKAMIAKVLEALKGLAIAVVAPQPVPVPVRVKSASRARRFYPR